jgi:alkylated DNA repair protein (DNA oxidative demethylase)
VTRDLFDDPGLPPPGGCEPLGPQAVVLRGFAAAEAPRLLDAIGTVESRSPFRHMVTPGGFTMSVAMTNCGDLGWITDRRGYRYGGIDPQTASPWPAMPEALAALARDAAAAAGFDGFVPDACLVNRYLPGTRLSLHQDRNERDFDAPIVSVSLGLPAVFLFGGDERHVRPARTPLFHGDVAVWGGESRLRYHGVLPLREGRHPLLGGQRINLTFRKAG